MMGSSIAFFGFASRTAFCVLIPAVLCSSIAGIVQPAMAIFLGRFFDSLSGYRGGTAGRAELSDRSQESIYGFVAIGIISWMVRSNFFCLWLIYGEMQARNVRDLLFKALLKKDLAWFEKHSSGADALVVRLHTQVHELQAGSSQPLGFICTCAVQILASTSVAFYYSWRLTLLVLGAVPVITLVITLIQIRLPAALTARNKALSNAAKVVSSTITNILTVKCSNTQDTEHMRYHQHILLAASCYIRQTRLSALEIGFSHFSSTAATIAIIYYGIVLIHQGELTTQRVMTTFWSCFAAVKAFEEILPHLQAVTQGNTAAASLRSIIHPPCGRAYDINAASDTGLCPDTLQGEIELQNVRGAITFLVGKSGSGKSTVSDLLLKFHEPRTGRILVDGCNIRDLNTSWLRNNITLVQQKSILFDETLSRNVALGHRDPAKVDHTSIEQCLEFGELLKVVKQLPQGVDTCIGLAGSALSGGQRQRVAIARARLRDAPILILDESTSALDHAIRTRLMSTLRRWRKGKSTIIVTHDLSQIADEDVVHVLEDGLAVTDGYRSASSAVLERNNGNTAILQPLAANLKGSDENDSTDIFCASCSKQDSCARPTAAIEDEMEQSTEVHLPPSRKSLTSIFAQGGKRLSFQLATGAGVLLNGQSKLSTAFTIRNIYQQSQFYRDHADPSISNFKTCSNKLAITKQAAATYRVSDTSHNNGSYTPFDSTGNLAETRQMAIQETPLHPMVQTRLDNDKKDIPNLQTIFATILPTLSWKHKAYLSAGFIAATVHAASLPLLAYLQTRMFGLFHQYGDWESQARSISLGIMSLAVGDGVVSYLMHLLLEKVGQQWVDHLRVLAFKRITAQPLLWFGDEVNKPSIICCTLDHNADEMRNLLGHLAAPIYVVSIMMAVAILWAFGQCWELTLVGLAAASTIYATGKVFQHVSYRWEARSNTEAERINAIFSESFLNIYTVRTLTLESYFHQKYVKAIESAFATGIQRAFYGGILFGLTDGVIYFAIAAIFKYGTTLVLSGIYPVEAILMVFSLLVFGMTNANVVLTRIPQISSGVDVASRLLRFCKPAESSQIPDGKTKLLPDDSSEHSGSIEFINHTFYYPSRRSTPALENLTFTIPPREITAIVGSSGSGKTTIVSLLLKLLPPSPTLIHPPSILISNHDIRTLCIPSLRNYIALVPQTPSILPGTIRENILYGQPSSDLSHASDTLATDAAKAADIHDFIISLPHGYETVVGETGSGSGSGLSGGQAQRIAIARALARNPRILILDEATSALDHGSAGRIRENIGRLVRGWEGEDGVVDDGRGRNGPGLRCHGMTVIAVTHAREMMEWADNVVVVKGGRAVEEGGYCELLERRGELWGLLSVV